MALPTVTSYIHSIATYSNAAAVLVGALGHKGLAWLYAKYVAAKAEAAKIAADVKKVV